MPKRGPLTGAYSIVSLARTLHKASDKAKNIWHIYLTNDIETELNTKAEYFRLLSVSLEIEANKTIQMKPKRK
jgi:hypothetical protein